MACVADKAAAESESSHCGDICPETEGTNITPKGKKKHNIECI